MVSDAGEQLHYGLVQLGGYTPFRSLQPEDRCHMFNVERANMVAMGSARYMRPKAMELVMETTWT